MSTKQKKVAFITGNYVFSWYDICISTHPKRRICFRVMHVKLPEKMKESTEITIFSFFFNEEEFEDAGVDQKSGRELVLE